MWRYLTAYSGILKNIHALAHGRAVEIQLPANLPHAIAKSQRIEGWMLHMQRMTNFVECDHRIHNQLALIADGTLLKEVAHLIAGLHEVQFLAVCILRLDSAKDFPVRLWCIHAKCPPCLIQCVNLIGLQKVLYDYVAILVELQVGSRVGTLVVAISTWHKYT